MREHVDRSARLGILENDETLADRDPVALFDKQFLHDAAIEMLDRFTVALDLDHGRRDDRTVQRGIGRPAAHPEKEHGDDTEPRGHRAARILFRKRRLVGGIVDGHVAHGCRS